MQMTDRGDLTSSLNARGEQEVEVVPGIAPLNARHKQQVEVAHSLIECKTQAKGGGGGNLYTTPSNAKGEEDKPPTPRWSQHSRLKPTDYPSLHLTAASVLTALLQVQFFVGA